MAKPINHENEDVYSVRFVYCKNHSSPSCTHLSRSRGLGTCDGCSRWTPEISANCNNCAFCKDSTNFRHGHVCTNDCDSSGYFGKQYCKDFNDYTTVSKSKSSGGCFISTAVLETLGKPDDCLELQALRNFRDNVLLTSRSYSKLVNIYYKIAPKLAGNPKVLQFSKHIYNAYIKNILILIVKNNHKSAISLYQKMVKFIVKICK